VPKSWIDDLCDNGDRNAWKAGEWGEAFAAISRNMSYRGSAPLRHGVHGQNPFIERANRIVIAKLSSQASRIDF
jgi:hypothetical protein